MQHPMKREEQDSPIVSTWESGKDPYPKIAMEVHLCVID